MRLPLTPPDELTAEQRPVYDNMKAGIEKNFGGFKAIADDGTLMGPWNPWLRWPKFGKPIWDLTLALSVSPSLPRPVREVAILVTGSTFHSAYELYAHVLAGEHRGLSDEKLATIVSGQRPSDLTLEEGVAYDVAAALLHHGTLPELSYRAAVKTFGPDGAAELIYLVGLYCLVSVTLNGFNVPIPEAEPE
ncbi:MAG TPA: carboxymuconolactone decarboxylase family protein [Xanthobacteraceae bacterium]|nr:carboxymuconolactone decarboxylase family protein [Xanthobacteraceae bacterium]